MIPIDIIGIISTFTLSLIVGVSGFALGGLISYFIWDKALKKKSNKIIKEAQVEADVIKKDKILQAKEKFLQLKAEHEKHINERNNKVIALENKLKQKEVNLSQRIEDNQRKHKEVEAIRENLQVQMEMVEKKGEELERAHRRQVEQLEAISGLSAQEAKQQLIESLKAEAKTEAMSEINAIMEEVSFQKASSIGSPSALSSCWRAN